VPDPDRSPRPSAGDAATALVARSLGLLAAVLVIVGVVRLVQGGIGTGLLLLVLGFVLVALAYAAVRSAAGRRRRRPRR